MLFAVVAVEILVTYSRIPAHDLYHVSGSGLTGGASRVLVFFNFPLAVAAIAIIALLSPSLTGRLAKVGVMVGLILCAAVFWPGVVKQSNLDARAVNTIVALGVLVALLLTVVAAVRLPRPVRFVRRSGDGLRVVVAVAALAFAVPWIAADLGFSFDGVPVLGTLYQTAELRASSPGGELHPAVHLGHHHGHDGMLLVIGALLLSRYVPSLRRGWLRNVVGAYIALMFCYGAGNIANDFWLEQVVKRGWTYWQIPSVTEPKATWAWGVIVVAAATLWGIAAWRARRLPDAIAPSAQTA